MRDPASFYFLRKAVAALRAGAREVLAAAPVAPRLRTAPGAAGVWFVKTGVWDPATAQTFRAQADCR